MKRDAAQTIFRTVVVAGAMLGSACGGKNPQPTTTTTTQPAGTTEGTAPTTPGTEAATPADPCAGQAADPCAAQEDPCAGADPCAANPCRPRPNADPCSRPTGRGFILS